MRGLVIVLSIIIFVSSCSSINSKTVYSNKTGNDSKFKTFTMAVCENKNDLMYCKDELFVNCSGKISKANDIKECNGFKIENKVTGFAVLNLVS